MKGLNAMGDYITTFTGKHFYPMSPDPMAICIEDIAHGDRMDTDYKTRLRCVSYNKKAVMS